MPRPPAGRERSAPRADPSAATPAITAGIVRTKGLLRKSRYRRELFRYRWRALLAVGTGITVAIQNGYVDTTRCGGLIHEYELAN